MMIKSDQIFKLTCDSSNTVTLSLSVRQLLSVPLPEDSSQLGTIFKLSHSSKTHILASCNGLASKINHLSGAKDIYVRSSRESV